MPKKSRYGDRDRIASTALRNIFPSYWNWKNPRDVDSGQEFSEDWIIEILDRQSDDLDIPTGAEFGVQNKTNPSISNAYATISLKGSDIRRLNDLPRPIMLHAYEIETKISYWIWLDNWLLDKDLPKWSDDEEISIKIPLECQLTTESINGIESHTKWFHQRYKAHRKADMANRRYSNDFDVQVKTDATNITTIIHAKHDGAIPQIVPLDKEANSILNYILQTGNPVLIKGEEKFKIQGIPEILQFDDEGSLVQTVILPHTLITPQYTPFKFEFLNGRGKSKFILPYVQMQLIQDGTLIKRWVGKHIPYSFTFELLLDVPTGRIKLHLNQQTQATELTDLARYVEVHEKTEGTKKIRVSRLDEEFSITFQTGKLFSRKLSPTVEASHRLIKALDRIQRSFKVTFSMPKSVSYKDLQIAEAIAEIISTGELPIAEDTLFIPPNGVLICGDPASNAKKLLEAFEVDGEIDIYIVSWTQDISFQIFGQTIVFQRAKYRFANAKILYVEELKQILSNPNLDEDETIEVIFEIDRSKVTYFFEDYPQS